MRRSIFLNNFLIFLFFSITKSSLVTKDPSKVQDLDGYTKKELELLPTFRTRVKDGLTLKYMFQNKYLIRFLRASNRNVDDAEKMMRENFRWRKQYNVDNIIHENQDKTKFARRFPFHFTWARDQRPTMVGSFNDFDLRQIVINGESQPMRRYVLYAIERAVWNIHLTSNWTGLEIITGNLLFNMAGFNVRTQACAACLPYWLEMAESYERYYPQLAHKIMVINIPRIFQRFYSLLKPLLTGNTLQAFELYSYDKSEWEPALRKLYSSDKLTLEFGGTSPKQRFYPLTTEYIEVQLGQAKTKNDTA